MKDRWVSVALSLAAGIPILWALLSGLLIEGRANFGSLDSSLPAYLNSACLSAAVASTAWIAAFYLVLQRRAIRECLIYAILLSFLPGELVAKGWDRLIIMTFGRYPPPIVEMVALIGANVSYIFPFITAGFVILFAFVGPATFQALDEIYPPGFRKSQVLFRAFWPQLLLAWLVGFSLCLAEVARTGVLAENVFGLGSQFFGPLVANAFAAGGVDLTLTILSLTPIAPIVVLALLLRRRSRHA